MISQDQLASFLDGALAAGPRAGIEAELERDAEALRFVIEQRKMDRALRSLLRSSAHRQRLKDSILAAVAAPSTRQLQAQVLADTSGRVVRPAENDYSTVDWLHPIGTWIGAILQSFRSPKVARFAFASVMVLLAVGAWVFFRPVPSTRIIVGQFAAVVGQPTLQHGGQNPTPNLLPSTPIHLGDRLETGDTDKAEIVFKDGTTLRLGFNTSVELPNLNAQRSTLNSLLSRPPEINLLRGLVWTKVQKMTNAPQYAIRTAVATAVARGTEFGVRLEQPRSGTSSTLKPQTSTPTAVLTVKEGVVGFSNALGSVQATAMTESTARADAPPTEPKRLQTLQVVRLDDSSTWSLMTSPLDWSEAAEKLTGGGGGSVGWQLRDLPNAAVTPEASLRSNRQEVCVSQLRRSSPAAQAGLQLGDILLALDGQSITNASQAERAILLRPNATVTPRVRRETEEKLVRLAVMPSTNLLRGPMLSVESAGRLTALLQQWVATPASGNGPVERRRHEEAGRISGASDVRAAAFNNLGVLFELEDALGPGIRAYGRAVYLAPQVPLYHFNLGLALRKIGSFERALEEFESAARLQSDSILAQKRLAEIHSLLGRDREALALTEALLQAAPQDHGAWELKAQLFLKTKRPAEAREAARRAIELDADCPVAHSYLAEALHAAGQLAEAEAARTETLERAPFEAVFHQNLGALQRDLNQDGLAERSFRRAIELRPDFALAWLNLGDLLLDRRDFASAEAALRKAVELDSGNAQPRRSLGNLAMKRREFAAAEAAFQQAVELSPSDPEAFYGLGETHRLRHRPGEAERAYRKAIELKAGYAAAHTGLGIVLQERGQFDEAEKLYRKAIELDSKESAPYNNLGNVYREARRNLDEAERFYRKALELAPNDAEPQSGLGLIAAERGDLAEAERLLRRAVELAPDSPGINNNMGEILRRRGRLDEAEPFYKKALGLDPENVAAYGNLGIIHAMRRQFDEAEKMFRALLQHSSGNDRLPALVNLATICGEQGKLDEAEGFFRQALTLSPDHPRVGNSLASFLADHQLKLDEALALATRAVRAEPNSPEYLDTLGWVQCQRGELAEAETTLKKALGLAGQEPPAPEIRDHLKKVREKKGAAPK